MTFLSVFSAMLAKKSLKVFTTSTGSSADLQYSCRVIPMLVDLVAAVLSYVITCQQAFAFFFVLMMHVAASFFCRFLSLRSKAFFISVV